MQKKNIKEDNQTKNNIDKRSWFRPKKATSIYNKTTFRNGSNSSCWYFLRILFCFLLYLVIVRRSLYRILIVQVNKTFGGNIQTLKP